MKSPSTIRLRPDTLARLRAIAEGQRLGPLTESTILRVCIERGLDKLEAALAASERVSEAPARE